MKNFICIYILCVCVTLIPADFFYYRKSDNERTIKIVLHIIAFGTGYFGWEIIRIILKIFFKKVEL